MENSPSLQPSQIEEFAPTILPELSPQSVSSVPPLNGRADASTQGFSERNKDLRSLGSIFTPPELADYLTSWAIDDPAGNVLDLGIGDGAFVWSALRRLQSLGTRPEVAQNQIYGAEIYEPAITRLMETANSQGLSLPNLKQGDFLSLDFPEVNAVIGNPPYVRRQYLTDVDILRRSIAEKQPEVAENLSRMTDLYIYFLLRASTYLREGGKLAVIVADSWLGANYGQEFKEFLKQRFVIERLISFDRKIFNVDVRAVMLLATKRQSVNQRSKVDFIRVKNGLSVQYLSNSVDILKNHKDISVFSVPQVNLDIRQIWHRYFSDADVLRELSSHPMMTHFDEQAKTRIGIQTLAKDFFVLTPDFVREFGIEDEFIAPMVHSIRTVNNLVIHPGSEPAYYLFHCGKSREDLEGTNALRYILQGESKAVPVRGKNQTVVGYQNKERIQRDFRPYWYDLTKELERRGKGVILIPRLIYKKLDLVWNRAQYVPGELFIEFLPLEQSLVDIEVYLAVLSSSIAEIMIRSRAQVYGGGTYNISPGLIKKAPLLDVRQLSQRDKHRLRDSYTQTTTQSKYNRRDTDAIIYEIMGITSSMQSRIQELLSDMRSGKEKLYQFPHH